MEEEPQQQSLAAEGEEERQTETAPTEEHEEEGEEAGGGEEDEEEAESEGLIIKAQALMEKITALPDNPNPNTIHALSSIFETQEASYMEESGHSAPNNGRSSHNVGRLGNLIRDNDEFFELISSKFLSERRYSVSVKAAAARLLFSCSLTWMYPHVFEDPVLENLKSWTTDDTTRLSGDDHYWKHESGDRRSSDSEMLKTYSTGLLAVCLASGGQVVEDVLTSGLPAKLMHYLRIRILGETTTSQRDATSLLDGKASSTGTGVRAREECRSRFRQVAESSHLDIPRVAEDGLHGDQVLDKDRDRSASRHMRGDELWTDEEPPDSMAVDDDNYEADGDGEERWHIRDLCDGKAKPGNRSVREDEHDESARDDLSRRRVNRGWTRHRGRGRVTEGVPDNEAALTSPGSASRLSGQSRSRNLTWNQELRRAPDNKKNLSRTNVDGFVMERDESDECFRECKVGSKDITDLVKKAVGAAETEAKTANAPAEAVKAAGDAAAEVVKSAAFEEFKKSNDEEAAVLAASKAASTVIDAAIAVEVSRSAIPEGESQDIKATAQEANEDVDEFFILIVTLLQSCEKFCIQCLIILGEYVEVLGPVIKRCKLSLLLPDVLKLICALAAHRKFAAVFVDRGGMQKLLAAPRAPQTFCGLSSCLFAIGSIQGIMERVCTLPSSIIHQVVELALQLLECPQDLARKNSALFFAAAFVFRAVVDSFDAQDGLQKMLNLLQDAALVRSGASSGALTASGSLRSDRSPPEVLTASEKQIAYHTCVALRQYFRAHLLLLVDSIRPNKSVRSAGRNIPSVRAASKPLDISNEAMDAVFRLIQKDRRLGPAAVRARWPVVDKFLNCNGHITMLELCQAPPVERYLHDLLQYALGVLHIVTLVPYSRKLIVNATLSNDRVGIAVILDAANSAGYVEPEIVEAALNVLVCLVCPPPSISNKPSVSTQAQQTNAVQSANTPGVETRDRNADRSETRDRNAERFLPDRAVNISSQNENRESTLSDRGSTAVPGTSAVSGTSQGPVSTVTSGLVGDRRISLGAGAGCAGLAAQLEQCYRQAREAVRANNGIKVLLQLLQPRIVTPPAAIDCLRALACRVLLGLARDDTIAHILTKLQVGKKLSELIRDSGNQTPGSEQNRWQAELAQVAIELIGVVTNSGRASSLAATDAATPTLRRIERAAIAAATPITYHARELLLLIHEHLQASGLTDTATMLLKEAQLTPLPSLAAPSSLAHQTSGQETSSVHIQWPSGRAPRGFLSAKPKLPSLDEDGGLKSESIVCSSRRKPLAFSSSRSVSSKSLPVEVSPSTSGCKFSNSKKCATPVATSETPSLSTVKSGGDPDIMFKTPIVLPMKRKLTDLKEGGSVASSDLRFVSLQIARRSGLPSDPNVPSTPNSTLREIHNRPGSSAFPTEGDDTPMRLTLDSVVVQYLKHQHRQCPAPITTLPPLSLLHLTPVLNQNGLDAPSNVTSRLSTRDFRSLNGGIRKAPWRTCRDDADSSQIAAGTHSGELKIFDSNSSSILESFTSHQAPLTLLQSYLSVETQLLLSSSAHDQFRTTFAALSAEQSRREILLYDTQTCQVELKLTDSSNIPSGRGHMYSLAHFSPSDNMLLWNGVLWDTRGSGPIHRFDQFTDYGGGGFHPAGNEVIINSEVWDLRNFRLLRSVPSLDQTVITFNASGDVIYAILRRNLEDVMSAFQTRRVKHPLFAAFRTVDAVNYSDIATIPVDRCVLDFATEPTDSFVGLVTMDDQDEMYSSARVYEIGRRRPTEDDSDPDDAESEDEDEDDDDDIDEEAILGTDLDGDGESDADDLSNDDDSVSELDDEEDEDGDFIVDGVDFGGGGILEIVTDGEDEDDSELVESFSSGDDDDDDLL
ncbi:hypothetical protein R3W88_021064 [Solanum pinnatisectum]|uniref:LisH domain-containing protein n=1 Tax=Solanum pinnatisectum TaxID=50273 RepID=A0AAV9LQS0_9SOLN|nr:hypothetical protein R3W88_021064 [Solanum pinnatisectum]